MTGTHVRNTDQCTDRSDIVWVFRSDTSSNASKLSIQFRKSGLMFPLKSECTLSLCPTSSLGLYRIHAFEGTLELLETAFFSHFSGSFLPLSDYKLLPDDRLQICNMVSHHLIQLGVLLDECFQSLQCRPFQESCMNFRDEELAWRV
jgi:hypothetical protein